MTTVAVDLSRGHLWVVLSSGLGLGVLGLLDVLETAAGICLALVLLASCVVVGVRHEGLSFLEMSV